MFVLVCIILLLSPESATKGAAEGLRVAFETVIPAILPFSVFSTALVYSYGKAIKSPDLTACITGFLGGYPTGCKTVCDMYNQGLIEKTDAEKMLAYTNNGGIIFALNVCGGAVFSSRWAGGIILLSNLIGAAASAVIFYNGKKPVQACDKLEKLPPMAILGRSIASGGSVIINIAASFVVTYAVLNGLKAESMPLLAGLGEMTKGIMYAGKINSLPLAALYFSFGGLGVYAQCAALCAEYNLSMKWYLPGKAVTGMAAFCAAYIMTNTDKDIILFSALTIVSIICTIKIIKRHAKA